MRSLLLALLLLAGAVPLVLVIPRLVPADPTVFSAAAAEGYNSAALHPVVLAWALLAIGAAIAATRAGWLSAAEPFEPPAPGEREGRTAELLIVALLVLVLLWPPFLARHGPYVEDKIFLNATHRMHGGMTPWRDFEFLYGPLMLYPLHGWMTLAGYGMKSYYAFLAMMEAAQYVLVAALLQRLIPGRRERLLVFLVLAAQLVNPLLGLNYNGIRRLLPAAGLLLLARDPASRRHALATGLLIGLAMAYAQDFGLAALAGAGALYAVLLLRAPSLRLALTGASVAASAAAAWLLTTLLLLRGGWPFYLEDARALIARFSAGEAGFRFYWTVNSLAGFGLVALATVVAGRALARVRISAWTWGDHFFIAALAGTLFSLKSGLNRSDVWHFDNSLFFLVVAFLLPLPALASSRSPAERRSGWALAALLGLTHLVGNAPLAAHMARGWLNGMRDTARGLPTAACAGTTAPCITAERTRPMTGMDSLSAWLAGPGRNRPVLLYGALWGIGPLIGVYKGDHINDDFIYADERGRRAGEWIASRPRGIVIMERAWHERLFAPPGADTVGYEPPFRPSLMKSAGEWLASVHYRGVVVERPLFELRWRRTAGQLVRQHFRETAAFGNYVVLEPYMPVSTPTARSTPPPSAGGRISTDTQPE